MKEIDGELKDRFIGFVLVDIIEKEISKEWED